MHPTAAAINDPATAASAGLLRLITCGSVDDGKSTLIGRMLYDSKSIYEDQLDALARTSATRGATGVDLALLTDGLRAEREQGITIDVAYRYFSTPKRTFILADTPGHIQYTRNMATGASTADLAVLLVDARSGVVEQTRRHACLASLLGIRHLVVCVNKMDLVNFDESRFRTIEADFRAFAAAARPDASRSVADSAEITFIPVSALDGDNVIQRSPRTAWHHGPTLIEHLESVPPHVADELGPARLPVQYVIRPQTAALHDYRSYAGQLARGRLRVGDEVVAMPGGQRSRITRIHVGESDLAECSAGRSVAVLLADDLDLTRGDMLAAVQATSGPAAPPAVSRDISATVVWMNSQPLSPARRVLVKHTHRIVPAIVQQIAHRLDIQSLGIVASPPHLALNEIGRVSLRFAQPIAYDFYDQCRTTGSFIIIDEATNNTVGAGMIAPQQA